MDMSICPHCGGHTPTPRHSEKLRSLFAARVGMPARVNRHSADAGHNALATEIVAAEDCIDPSRAFSEPRRAVGFIEVKPGEEMEPFDADWDGGVK